jgi:hypothetical protein
MIFGEGKDEEIKKYVDGVFAKFDDNHSGALSFSESREFIKGLITWFDKEGILNDQESAELLKTVLSDELPSEEEPAKAVVASEATTEESTTQVASTTTTIVSETIEEVTITTTETTATQETVSEVTAEDSTSVTEVTKVTSETVTESTTDSMDSDGEISIPQPTLVQNAPAQTSEEESIEIIEDVPKSSPEPEIINSDDGNELANDESSPIDTGSAQNSRPIRGKNDDTEENSENVDVNITEETVAENPKSEDDSDELVIPDGPENQVQSCIVDSDQEESNEETTDETAEETTKEATKETAEETTEETEDADEVINEDTEEVTENVAVELTEDIQAVQIDEPTPAEPIESVDQVQVDQNDDSDGIEISDIKNRVQVHAEPETSSTSEDEEENTTKATEEQTSEQDTTEAEKTTENVGNSEEEASPEDGDEITVEITEVTSVEPEGKPSGERMGRQ